MALTERASRDTTPGRLQTWRRWLGALGAEPTARASVGEQLKRAPIILAAVDVSNATEPLLDLQRETVRRIVAAEPGARLACVGVMKTNRIGMDELTDRSGNSLHVKQLVGLKHWARPIAQSLVLGTGRLTFHVLEAPDVAEALLEFSRRTQVDHIIMGARARSTLRRYLGTVSSKVVADADCTVTVVRRPAAQGDEES
jgi:nucleotide-binding universal stress UspA family protein